MIALAALLFVLATAALTYLATGLVLGRLIAARVVDVPNQRSSHQAATPRGGGIGVMAALLPALLLAGFVAGRPGEAAILIAAAAVLAAVSFLDDLKPRPASMRLAVQAGAVAAGLFALGDGLVFQGLLPFWLDRLAAGFLWLWFVNLYNFMDGIDGITAAQTIAIGAGAAMLAALVPAPALVALAGCALAGAGAGFLPWNRHVARIFLGDVGSVPLGFIAGFVLLQLAVSGYWAAALCLPLYYLADATLTLLRRMARGERFWEAHREHAYQYAAAGAGHARTLTSIAVALAGLVVLALPAGLFSSWFLAVALFVVAALMARLYALAAPPR